MGKVALYLAISVDGYIADQEGGVAWIAGDGSQPDALGSYESFYEKVDTVVMGWRTYHQIVTELSSDNWPYEGRACYVVTHRQQDDREGIYFWNEDLTDLVDRLRQEHEGVIWICGGASVSSQLLKENRIDQLWLSMIPIVLGGGVRLFSDMQQELPLKLVRTEQYNGIVDLVYEKR